MSRRITLALVFGLAAALIPSSHGQQPNDGGYRRQLEEARKEKKIESRTGAELIELLGDRWFYAREAAELELQARGVAEYDRILDCTANGDLEQSNRARRILNAIGGRRYSELRQRYEPKSLTLEVKSPRFWAGTNQWKGGVPDQSLDADITIKSDVPLLNVTSPLPVKSAKTDGGETLETLPWSFSNCSTTSGVVYFTKPQIAFTKIDAELWVRGIVHGEPDKASEKLEPGKKEWHKNAFWGEVTKSEKAVGQYALVVTDIMGRLEKAEVKFFAADGSTSAAKIECERGRFRGVWRIDTEGGKHVPARYEVELPAPTFYVERAVKVTVSHP